MRWKILKGVTFVRFRTDSSVRSRQVSEHELVQTSSSNQNPLTQPLLLEEEDGNHLDDRQGDGYGSAVGERRGGLIFAADAAIGAAAAARCALSAAAIAASAARRAAAASARATEVDRWKLDTSCGIGQSDTLALPMGQLLERMREEVARGRAEMRKSFEETHSSFGASFIKDARDAEHSAPRRAAL